MVNSTRDSRRSTCLGMLLLENVVLHLSSRKHKDLEGNTKGVGVWGTTHQEDAYIHIYKESTDCPRDFCL